MPKIKREKEPKINKFYQPELKTPQRNWVFTQHQNPEVDINLEEFKVIPWVQQNVRYLVYQHELSPTTDKHHWQGYIQLHTPQRYTTINKNIPQLFKAHYEAARGTAKEAGDYCLKDETRIPNTIRFEYGTRIDQGQRTDLERIQESIEGGATMKEIAVNHFSEWVFHRRAFAEYQTMFKPRFQHEFTLDQYSEKMSSDIFSKAVLVYGPSGIGKTNWVLAHFENPLLISHMDQLKDITPEHDALVFDDISFKHMPIGSVIHLLDMKFDRQIHTRYSNATIPKGMKRVFTYNLSNPFYDDNLTHAEHKNAVDRRLTKIHVTKLFAEPVQTLDLSDLVQ